MTQYGLAIERHDDGSYEATLMLDGRVVGTGADYTAAAAAIEAIAGGVSDDDSNAA